MTERTAAVAARLADEDPEARRRATQEIPSLPAPESCDLLLRALGDVDWRVRKEAAAVAARVEPRTAVVFAVARALGDRDAVGLRNAAVEALVLIGPDAVPGAIDALSRLDGDGRKLAVEVLTGAPTLGGIRALVRGLADVDANVVVAAAEGLGRAHLAGEAARELARGALASLLSTSELPAAKLAALDALRSLEVEIPFTQLEPLLHDPLLRRPALAALGGTRVPRGLRALAVGTADPVASVARDAVASLGHSIEEAWGEDELLDIAAKTLRVLPAARARLRLLAAAVDDPVARGAAILALGLVRDPDDVPLVADALADDAVADRAEATLRLFGQDAVESLLVAGRTAAPSLRGAALSMLPQLAPSTSQPLEAVREALSDPSADVVAPALKSLAIVGSAVDIALVARHVVSRDSKVASAAQAALTAIATRHPAAARAAVAPSDPRGDDVLAAVLVRGAAAASGAKLDDDATFLASALTHREAVVRRAAIEALAHVGGEDAVQAVAFSLADEEDVVAHAAIRALGTLGRADQLASMAATTRDPIRIGVVLRALRDADPERAFAAARPLVRDRVAAVAAAAVEVVGSTKVAARVEALLDAADHPDYEVVKLALARLAETRDVRAMVAMTRAVEHASENVRRYAAELLGHAGGPEVEAILRSRLDREPSGTVRLVLMGALAARSRGEPGP
jgi:HEAT repeat protein